MKIVTLRAGEAVIINHKVKVTVNSIKANKAQLAFKAPKSISISSMRIKD